MDMSDGGKKKDAELESVMDALKALKESPNTKSPGKKKVKRKPHHKKPRKSVAFVEDAEFEYNWPKCACGMNHPPVPTFKPPDGKRCTYYWQVADLFPYMTLHRALTTELKFIEADADQSGLLELDELKTLLKGVLGEKVSDNMVEKTFSEIDQDGSGTLDFSEVLSIVDALIQREHTNLPSTMQKEYSKVCSIQ